ncbi:MAG: cyclic lactone autoinducer peptide [Ruminococcus sp.]|nr:cyclic lactone autoinducer peptide [Ruminococcus sp.]HCW13014.1 cyclic lactone autoinducer peptide [Ruminococcus sp.]
MKQTSKKVLQVAASIAKKSSSFWANFPCTWWQYQPKTPKSVKKMRKF